MKILLAAKILLLGSLLSARANETHFTRSEGSIQNVRDGRTGLVLEDHFTKDDQNQLSLGLLANSDPRQVTDILGLEGRYHKRTSFGWLSFSASYLKAEYQRITHDNPFLPTADSDINTSSPTLFNFSAGLAYRTTYIQNFMSDRWYEFMGAGIAYTILNDSVRSKTFHGPGLRADLGLQYRLSQTYFWGFTASYQISSVADSENPDDVSYGKRNLVLNWLTFGIELGIVF